jgi:hypothetical protein
MAGSPNGLYRCLASTSCRLRIKYACEVTMQNLIDHIDMKVSEWPSQQMQALEILLNTPFLADPNLLYTSRTLYELSQTQVCQSLMPAFSGPSDRAAAHCVEVARGSDCAIDQVSSQCMLKKISSQCMLKRFHRSAC